MSLIQEALKRQMEEQKETTTTDGASSPAAPGSPPPPAQTAKPLSSLKLAQPIPKKDNETEAAQQQEPSTEQSTTDQGKTPPSKIPNSVLKTFGGKKFSKRTVILAAVALLLVILAAKSLFRKPDSPDIADQDLTIPTPADDTNIQDATVPKETSDATEDTTTTTENDNTVVIADVEDEDFIQWPYLIVTGIVGQGKKGSVVINNKVIGVGDTVDGARIVSIGNKGVNLEYRGEKRFVKVGESTDF